jgi:hypothetical protein
LAAVCGEVQEKKGQIEVSPDLDFSETSPDGQNSSITKPFTITRWIENLVGPPRVSVFHLGIPHGWALKIHLSPEQVHT